MLIVMTKEQRGHWEYLIGDLIQLVGEAGWVREGFLEVVTLKPKEGPKGEVERGKVLMAKKIGRAHV